MIAGGLLGQLRKNKRAITPARAREDHECISHILDAKDIFSGIDRKDISNRKT